MKRIIAGIAAVVITISCVVFVVVRTDQNGDEALSKARAAGYARDYRTAILNYEECLIMIDKGLEESRSGYLPWFKGMTIDKRENQIEAYKGIADSSMSLGDHAKAVEYYQKVLSFLKHDLHSRFGIAAAYEALGETAKVQEHLNLAVQLSPEHFMGYHRRAKFFLTHKNWSAAKADLLMSAKRPSTSSEPSRDLAWLASTCPVNELRDSALALQYAKVALSKTMAIGLSGKPFAERAWWEPISQIEGSLEYTAPDLIENLDVLAAAYAEAGQFERAVGVMENAIRISKVRGQNPEAQKQLNDHLLAYKNSQPWRNSE